MHRGTFRLEILMLILIWPANSPDGFTQYLVSLPSRSPGKFTPDLENVFVQPITKVLNIMIG